MPVILQNDTYYKELNLFSALKIAVKIFRKNEKDKSCKALRQLAVSKVYTDNKQEISARQFMKQYQVPIKYHLDNCGDIQIDLMEFYKQLAEQTNNLSLYKGRTYTFASSILNQFANYIARNLDTELTKDDTLKPFLTIVKISTEPVTNKKIIKAAMKGDTCAYTYRHHSNMTNWSLFEDCRDCILVPTKNLVPGDYAVALYFEDGNENDTLWVIGHNLKRKLTYKQLQEFMNIDINDCKLFVY